MKGKQKQQQQQLQHDKENPLNLVTKLIFHERQGYDLLEAVKKNSCLNLKFFKGHCGPKLGGQKWTFLLDMTEVFPEIAFKWYVISEWWVNFDKISMSDHGYQSIYSFARFERRT